MELTILDYGILAMTLGGAVVGLFIGFSGALAFLAGLGVSVAAGFFAWPQSAAWISSVWLRALAVGVGALVVFGLSRLIVKKCVHGLVAQPGDALLGLTFAALAGATLSLGAAWGLSLVFPDDPDFASSLLERALSLAGR